MGWRKHRKEQIGIIKYHEKRIQMEKNKEFKLTAYQQDAFYNDGRPRFPEHHELPSKWRMPGQEHLQVVSDFIESFAPILHDFTPEYKLGGLELFTSMRTAISNIKFGSQSNKGIGPKLKEERNERQIAGNNY